jgi:hypothetical protein
MMEVQSGWKWNEWRNALSVLTILHEERRKREGKERELSYMEVLSHGDASDIQQQRLRVPVLYLLLLLLVASCFYNE